MPNWCHNSLHISGSSDDIKQFIEANTGLPAQCPLTEREKLAGVPQEPSVTEPHFCFNALVPTPQAVLELGYDGRQKLNAIAEEQGEEAIEGIMDGWEWNNRNWGTDRDIYWENITLENCGWAEGITELVLCFYTAWNPPVRWLIQISPQFPTLRLELDYAEIGMCIAGEVICENGSINENHYDRVTCMKMFGYIDDTDEYSEDVEKLVGVRKCLFEVFSFFRWKWYRTKRWIRRTLKIEKEDEWLPF